MMETSKGARYTALSVGLPKAVFNYRCPLPGTIGVRGGIHSGPFMRKELESRLKVVEIKIGLRKVNIVLEVRSFPFTPA